MKSLADCSITIVGLGLMGGSLAGALRGQCAEIVGVDQRAGAVEMALARGLIDRGARDLLAGVQAADAVILATPVRAILELLGVVGPRLPAGCLVMDLGSTKARIVERMADLPAHVEPIGGHPMCGREASGIEAADPELYRDCLFLLTPLPRTGADALALARVIVLAAGARPQPIAPDEHDRLAALVSHLPALLSCGLVLTADRAALADERVWQMAASGFRDMSRLAAGDVDMLLDILLTNREAILSSLAHYREQLDCLSKGIAAADEQSLRQALQRARQARKDYVV